jgi:ectoine hydroxylase-related dioxygenase (phytanoyl-CoA dioxygenase family)
LDPTVIAFSALKDFPPIVAHALGVQAEDLMHLHLRDLTVREWMERFYDNAGAEFWATYAVTVAEFAKMFVKEAWLYQARPSFRVQYPGSRTLEPHRDADYGHQLEEVNVWIPLVPLEPSTTLRIADKPWPCAVGEALAFSGGATIHECPVNVSERTRVSFDFRLLAEAKLRPDGWTEDGTRRFALGGFWSRG